jgi:hypothetical protein
MLRISACGPSTLTQDRTRVPGWFDYRIAASSDGNQGREMAVTVAKFKRLDAASARLHSVADRSVQAGPP